jgi:hypothetical protein
MTIPQADVLAMLVPHEDAIAQLIYIGGLGTILVLSLAAVLVVVARERRRR